MKRLLAFVLFLALLASAAARAAVSSVAVSPSAYPVDVSGTTVVPVTWLVVTSGGGTVQSAPGQFETEEGKVLGTAGEVLSQSLTGPGRALLTESLRVPDMVAVRAHLMGHQTIYFRRVFDDGSGNATGGLALRIAAGANAKLRLSGANADVSPNSFDIDHLRIAFDKNQPFVTVARGAPLTVRASIRYASSGFIYASWEVAGPNPGTSPRFRALTSINQLLDTPSEAVFTSSLLPTDEPGMYLVRLEVTTPALSYDEPEIRYLVTP
jgi:hypothetical protein